MILLALSFLPAGALSLSLANENKAGWKGSLDRKEEGRKGEEEKSPFQSYISLIVCGSQGAWYVATVRTYSVQWQHAGIRVRGSPDNGSKRYRGLFILFNYIFLLFTLVPMCIYSLTSPFSPPSVISAARAQKSLYFFFLFFSSPSPHTSSSFFGVSLLSAPRILYYCTTRTHTANTLITTFTYYL